MVFRKERTEVIANQLKKLATVQSELISGWQIKKGTFFHPDEADKSSAPWSDFDSRTMHWTGTDEHYWFRSVVTVPQNFDGKPLSLLFHTQIEEWDDAKNPQFLIFINNEPVQGIDMNHRDVFITDCAKAGDKFTVDLQAYTGTLHSDFMLVSKMIEVDLLINKLYYDIVVPLQIVKKLEPDDKTRIELEMALIKVINILDLRVPYSKEFYESVKAAEDCIQEVIYTNLAGFDDVIATCIGHTHIDVAWWWTVAQTREKVARSFATVLKLMDEYPEYKFMSSQPQLYDFLKQRYPELYARIKERIKEGRWEPEGGMWLEADCNLTSGESLVRQFMHGKKFFKDEFGIDNKILWLPDVFGYSAALPQIMKKSGIKYFMTTKIAWNQFNKFPYDTFWWQGIDGTPIFTYLVTTKDVDQPKESFFTTYNGKIHPSSLIGGWERYQQKELNNDILISYGYGDGGGGPTREMVETGLRMEKGIKGAPKVRFETSRKFFDELYDRVADNKQLPKWEGELYLEYHRGTYTSMARNKKGNRKSEFLLQDLEFISTLAEKYGVAYPKEEIYSMWEKVLLNQFHDILPGSSIHEVYEVTKKEYAELKEKAQKLLCERLETVASKLCEADYDVAVVNTLGFERNDIAVIDNLGDTCCLEDKSGNKFPVQKTADGKSVAYLKNIPSKGGKAFKKANCDCNVENNISVSKDAVTTPFYDIDIDERGMFTKIFDRKNKRDVLKPGMRGNVLRVYEDKPIYYDNWDIDIFYTEKSWEVNDVESMTWTEKGPVRATLEIIRNYSKSKIHQKIHFYADSPRIDFETWVDWKEHQQLLKVEFFVDINATEATYDIQFGNIKRPTHSNTSWDMARFEVCGHKWADVSEGGYGVSLLNDCKYGHGIKDGKMTLSLIKSGTEPNPVTDQEEHTFTYSLLPHAEGWQQANVEEASYKLNVPLYTATCNNGSGNGEFSLFTVSAKNVVAETVKKAEDGNGTIIRMFEDQNRRGSVTVNWADNFSEVYECDLLENNEKKLASNAKDFTFEIKPYEIKTFRVL